MNLFSSSWNFLKKHKGKIFLATGFVGGLVVLNRILGQFERSWERSSAKDFVSEVRKKETHFENTIQTCNSTIKVFTTKILTLLDYILSTDSILDELKKSTGNKIALWKELRVRIISRCIAEIYCLSFFVCLLRVQLSIIAGYLYVNSNSAQDVINPSIQIKYLSQINNFYDKGIHQMIELIQQAVDQAISDISLKEKIGIEELKNILEKIKRSMHFVLYSTESFGEKYIIDSKKIVFEMRDQLSSEEAIIMDRMMAETHDILESDDFKTVFDSCINIGFSIMTERFLNCILKFGQMGSEEVINIHLIQVPFVKLLPEIKNDLYEWKKSDENSSLLRHLLCSEILNCFAANVYEEFCDPYASAKNIEFKESPLPYFEDK